MPTRRRSSITSRAGSSDLLAVEEDAAGGAHVVDQVVHAVQAAQQGRFAAARGADQGGHLVAGKVHAMSLKAAAVP